MYSSLCSGIRDVAAVYNDPAYPRLDAIWIAAWNGLPNIFGFPPPCPLSDAVWPFHQRIHQYQGGHNETWGGVTINIDRNAVDGPLFPVTTSAPALSPCWWPSRTHRCSTR